MNKGQVVEEGDHKSLMAARGTYFGLVEQQTLRQAEEEEQIKFEQQETAKLLLSEQLDLDDLNVRKDRRSTIISLTASILTKLYGKKNSIIDDSDDLKADEKIKTVKVIKMEENLEYLN
jgi:hypothetical protein